MQLIDEAQQIVEMVLNRPYVLKAVLGTVAAVTALKVLATGFGAAKSIAVSGLHVVNKVTSIGREKRYLKAQAKQQAVAILRVHHAREREDRKEIKKLGDGEFINSGPGSSMSFGFFDPNAGVSSGPGIGSASFISAPTAGAVTLSNPLEIRAAVEKALQEKKTPQLAVGQWARAKRDVAGSYRPWAPVEHLKAGDCVLLASGRDGMGRISYHMTNASINTASADAFEPLPPV